MLHLDHITCSRGQRQLFNSIDLKIDSGTLIHVQGTNGSGKTTLLRAIAGLLHPDTGSIFWDGKNIRGIYEDYCREMLYLGHLDGIKADLTGLENLRIAATLHGNKITENQEIEIFSLMGLGGLEELPCRVLSQGQKRRVALARLFAAKARLWIMDEPFVGLDAVIIPSLLQLIKSQVAKGGIVVLTTHQEVTLTAGTIQRLRLGEIPNFV
ncbi:heme ABC transporter ATP-binding protein [Achromatium sp. WMS2]|nr:heme ABC transporter ATP-binding protein [Achromatium sp. WMS2]